MNTDEALRCLEIARESILKKDFSKAEKFLAKSIRLNETTEAKILLKSLDVVKRKASEQS